MERLRRAEEKAQKKAAFIVAMRNGLSATQAATSVGVSKPTGLSWARKIKAEEGILSARSTILQKQELAEVFSEIAENAEESAAYRVSAGVALSKLQGYDAPARSEVTMRVIPESVMSWLVESNTIDVEPEPAAPAQLPTTPTTKALGE